MKAYEDLLYEQWRQQVEATLPVLLKRNLLAKLDATVGVKREIKANDIEGKTDRLSCGN